MICGGYLFLFLTKRTKHHQTTFKNIKKKNMIALIRTATKNVKKSAYESNLQELNKDEKDCKYLAIADVEVATANKVGVVTEHPSLIGGLKNMASAALGRNKRVFVAVQSNEGEVLYLFLHPDEHVDEDDKLLEGANLDAGFAADRGVSVLTASNTVVKRKKNCKAGENVFVFEPTQSHLLKRATYEVKVVVGPGKNSDKNAASTVAYLDSLARKQ